MVWTHQDPLLCKQVKELSKAAGFRWCDGDDQEAYVFGEWRSVSSKTTVLFTINWDVDLFNRQPDWPRFNAATEMDKIRIHFGADPEKVYDESPLPYIMNEEQSKETRKKFNLSPEQWESYPPMVQQALAGASVVLAPFEWYRLGEGPAAGLTFDTVLFTSSENPRGNAKLVGVGYFKNESTMEFNMVVNKELRPTHWAPLPGTRNPDIVDNLDDDEDQDPSED